MNSKKGKKLTVDIDDIHSTKNAWLGLPDNFNIDDLINPLAKPSVWEKEHLDIFLGRLLTNPAYFMTTCKYLLNINLVPLQAAILKEMWFRAFPMLIMTRGGGKSFLLSVYSILRSIIIPNTRVVIVGSGFRQSKFLFEYMQKIWNNAPILRDICSQESGPKIEVDRVTMTINDSSVTCIPVGPGGEKIRGLRSTCTINDEFQSSAPDIYETVIQGFGAVSQDVFPSVQKAAEREKLIKRGLWTEEREIVYRSGSSNQSIISGTADYSFRHFYDYWQKYKKIITSRGDENAMRQIFEGKTPEGITWKDFSILRIPVELMPPGFMDDKAIGRARANSHTGIFEMEYACVFRKDSSGFFKRTLIESCVTSEANPIRGQVFDPVVRGNLKKKYVYGIDPAIQGDNFAIVILELDQDHWKVVYCWTTNKKDFEKRKKINSAIEHDYYAFCARKIRNLMKTFPCVRIGMDTQGGGYSIEEALHNPKNLEPGSNEQLIWPIKEENKEKLTDHMEGQHILELIQFADYEWTAGANNGLRKDLEDKTLLFPRYDALTIGMAYELGSVQLDTTNQEDISIKTFDPYDDSLEDCIFEIEELKNELTTIVMSVTGTGQGARNRWDTPENKDMVTKKKGRLRKDRYSALLIANMIARQMAYKLVPPPRFSGVGGSTRELAEKARAKQEVGKLFNTSKDGWQNVSLGMFGAIKKR